MTASCSPRPRTPTCLYDIQNRLAEFHFYTGAEVNHFAKIYFDRKATQDKLHAALTPAVDRFKAASREEQTEFRGQLKDYVRLYAFLSQIIPFVDPDLEKLYVFCRLLLRKCVLEVDRLPVEVQQAIDMESYRLNETHKGTIYLERGTAEVKPIVAKDAGYRPEDPEALSTIIKELNERFGTDFSEDDRVFITQLEEKLAMDAALEASVRVNQPENARLTFNNVMNDQVQEMIDANFKFYKQINDDKQFGKFFGDWLFERYLQTRGTGDSAANR